MKLDVARLCLDCEEVHDSQKCPVCASETFAYLRRWVPSDGKPQKPEVKDGVKMMPYERFFFDDLTHHGHQGRIGYLNQKILEPRSYDYRMTDAETRKETGRIWEREKLSPLLTVDRDESDAEYDEHAPPPSSG